MYTNESWIDIKKKLELNDYSQKEKPDILVLYICIVSNRNQAELKVLALASMD